MSRKEKLVTTIIGECGQFQIHKVWIKSGRVLGIEVQATEWLDKDLRDAFPGAVSYSKVSSVTIGSIADELGIQIKDVLCWPNGPAPVVFHDLCDEGKKCTWSLLDNEKFEEIVQKRPCTLYLARKKDKTASVSGGVSISKAMIEKLSTFSSLSRNEQEQLLQKAKDDAKKIFEEERDAILAALPSSIKSHFGQMGFAKWAKQDLPALILNPFDVPPGQVRDKWLNMFERTKRSGTLGKLSYLVYWYGSKDASSHYGFIPQKEFTSYAAGVKKKFHKIPARIQKKLDGKKKLTKGDKEIVDQFEEMRQDLKRKPANRKRGVVEFAERYELLSEKDCMGLQASCSDSIEFSGGSRHLEEQKKAAEPEKAFRTKASRTKKTREKVEIADEQNKLAAENRKPIHEKVLEATARKRKRNAVEKSDSSKRQTVAKGRPDAKPTKLPQSDSSTSNALIQEGCSAAAKSSMKQAGKKSKGLASGRIDESVEPFLERFDTANKGVRDYIFQLHAQIADLKADHEKEVHQLQTENAGLKKENAQLKQDLLSVTKVVKKYSK